AGPAPSTGSPPRPACRPGARPAAGAEHRARPSLPDQTGRRRPTSRRGPGGVTPPGPGKGQPGTLVRSRPGGSMPGPGTKNNGPVAACAGNFNHGGTPQQGSLGSPPARGHPGPPASPGQQKIRATDPVTHPSGACPGAASAPAVPAPPSAAGPAVG